MFLQWRGRKKPFLESENLCRIQTWIYFIIIYKFPIGCALCINNNYHMPEHTDVPKCPISHVWEAIIREKKIFCEIIS